MQTAFEITMPRRIVFGRGKAEAMVDDLASLGRRILIVHGRSRMRVEWLIAALETRCEAVATSACAGEPDLATVEAAVAEARHAGVDAVIAIGGGAAIDLGKAVAGLARVSGPVTDYLEVIGAGRALDSEPLPFAALPTTAGTGAEATRNAVIGVAEHRRKVSLRDPRMLADLVVVDPALTDGCPRDVTLASGLDAITQLIEPYLSVKANPFTDGLVHSALPPALAAIRRLAEGEDAAARDAMSRASLWSGLALANAGLGAVHGLAGVIGGMTGAPHGEICASLLAATLAANRRAVAAAGRDGTRINEIDAMLAAAFSDQPGACGFDKLGRWIGASGIGTIDALGLAADDFAAVADQSQGSSSMRGNPVPLTTTDLIEILERSAA